MVKPFWQTTALRAMSSAQWESLCDGCGQCCLHKLEDEDTEEVFYTCVACQLIDDQSRCSDYQNRLERVPECLSLKPEDIVNFHWLPKTCAYRLLSEGQDLPNWHPLISGDANTVHSAGVSIKGRFFREQDVDEQDLEDYIINWVL